jgi:hypothetical protein
VSAQLSGYAACERVLIRIELRPGGRHRFDSDARYKASAETVGGCTLMAIAPGEGILAHRQADGALHSYVALNKPEDWIARIAFSDPVAALARVAEEFDGWAPALTALITESETDPVPRPIHALPVEHIWDRLPGVTLLEIGDLAQSPNVTPRARRKHPDDGDASSWRDSQLIMLVVNPVAPGVEWRSCDS